MDDLIKAEYDLIEAAWSGDLGLVKSSVENGADIHVMDNCAIRRATEHGYLEMVKYLINQGANIHNDHIISLRWALYDGHLEVVKYLKSVYIERYKERFLCFNCLVLPCCTELCSNELVKSKRKMK